MFSGAQVGGSSSGLAGESCRFSQKEMIRTRGGSGLGDAIYLQSVAKHWVERGHRVEVCSAWPDVFLPLGDRVDVAPFRRDRIDRLAHYAQRRAAVGSTQFEDCCIQAGITETVDLRIDWQPRNVELVERLSSVGRPVIVLQMPRAPFGRTDGFGAEFLPDCRAIQRIIDRVGTCGYFVQIGMGSALYQFSGVDLDLTNQTSVSDVLDVGYAAHGFLGYCSFIIPLAESFSKPVLLVWSRRGLNSPHEVVRQMTPQKILHRASSRYVVDDWPDADITRSADALYEQIRSLAVV